jgi:hypothetical protein
MEINQESVYSSYTHLNRKELDSLGKKKGFLADWELKTALRIEQGDPSKQS